MDIHFRSFQEEDIDLYAQGQEEAFSSSYPGITITEQFKSELRGHVLRSIGTNASVGITAMLKQQPIGFLMLGTQYLQDLPVGYIENIFVREEYRKRGYGAKLLDAAEKHFRENGYRILQLDVSVHNHEALSLYRAHGYAVGSYLMEKNIAL